MRIPLSLALAAAVMSFGSLRAKWYELTAPKLTEQDLINSPVSVEAQRQRLIEFEFKLCQASTSCADATLGGEQAMIVATCKDSARRIAALAIPPELPPAVKKNLSVYHQSMINSENLIADRWKEKDLDGGRLWTFLKNWEVDTCSSNSIPQKVRRLYQLDRLSQASLVTCKEIEDLYSHRTPAAIQ
jgi:hypothetical protein